MKTTRSRAIVLRRTNYGEADRIIDLLTPSGRISVIARGVRKEKSKLAGGIELFAVCDVVVGEGKGELKTLISARIIAFYGNILLSFDRMQFAYEVLSQVAKASSSLATKDWFEIVSEVLEELHVGKVPLNLAETWYYIRVVQVLGEELNTLRDCEGAKLHPDKTYVYDNQEKCFRVDQKGTITENHIKILRLCSLKSLKVLAQIGGMENYLDICLSISRQHAALRG